MPYLRVLITYLNKDEEMSKKLWPRTFRNFEEAQKWCFAFASGISDTLDNENNKIVVESEHEVDVTNWCSLRIVDDV